MFSGRMQGNYYSLVYNSGAMVRRPLDYGALRYKLGRLELSSWAIRAEVCPNISQSARRKGPQDRPDLREK